MFRVRRLGPADEELAASVTVAFDGESAGRDHLRGWLADPARQFVVAIDDGDCPVGRAYAYELPRLKKDAAGVLLYEIDVSESFRRRGVGRAMIAEILRTARERGADRMWVLTNASNSAAMRLYESLGASRTNPDDVMWEWPIA